MKELTWSDCGRDDLQGIALAEKYGWRVCFEYWDKNYGRVTPEYPPINPVGFDLLGEDGKEIKHIWKTYKYVPNPDSPYVMGVKMQFNMIVSVWHCADMVNGRYCNHRKYETIEDAFIAESKVKV